MASSRGTFLGAAWGAQRGRPGFCPRGEVDNGWTMRLRSRSPGRDLFVPCAQTHHLIFPHLRPERVLYLQSLHHVPRELCKALFHSLGTPHIPLPNVGFAVFLQHQRPSGRIIKVSSKCLCLTYLGICPFYAVWEPIYIACINAFPLTLSPQRILMWP